MALFELHLMCAIGGKCAVDYATHIQSLAQAHGVSIEIARPGYAGRAWRKAKKVKIAEVKTAVTYALALHELGHVLGKQSGNRLHKEWQAWEWAMANAEEWTEPMARKMQRGLVSYLCWCQRRRGAWVPPDGHPVWSAAGCNVSS